MIRIFRTKQELRFDVGMDKDYGVEVWTGSVWLRAGCGCRGPPPVFNMDLVFSLPLPLVFRMDVG